VKLSALELKREFSNLYTVKLFLSSKLALQPINNRKKNKGKI
jgi:hypothetical protein